METKICPRCKKEKELVLDNFYFHKLKGKKQWALPCITCAKEKQAINLAKNKEEVYSRNRKYYAERGSSQVEHQAYKRYINRANRRYGLSEQSLRDMMDQQVGCCAICGESLPLSSRPGERSFSIDHCHKTGLVRGLLCSGCNTGLGNLGDSVEQLTSAVQYLNKYLIISRS